MRVGLLHIWGGKKKDSVELMQYGSHQFKIRYVIFFFFPLSNSNSNGAKMVRM